jgi:putative sporulation protein YtxC
MKSLTIVMRNSAEHRAVEWFDSLDNKLTMKHVHKGDFNLHLNCKSYDTFSVIQIHMPDKLVPELCSLIADYIVNQKESSILLDMMKKEFQMEAAEDVRSVEMYCKKFLNEDKVTLSSISALLNRRQAYITEQIETYFGENSLIVIEGFVRFRLQEYLEELRMLVEVALDECLMDRQYQEFISLLQYFVYMQESKIPSAHLIHQGGHEFLILNERFEAIDMKEFDTTLKLEVLDKDINFEDMIVSTLITVAPATIHIHTREPELLVIKTIRQIFEGRTELCSYCLKCQAYLGDVTKKDQLSP